MDKHRSILLSTTDYLLPKSIYFSMSNTIPCGPPSLAG
jgi:hypothetical protein